MTAVLEERQIKDAADASTHAAIPFLMNDKAGALRTTASADEMRDLGREQGLDLDIISTTSPEDTQETIARLVKSGATRIAVAGGDGTVACAVQALAGTGVTLGIVAQGTANNFATALRLPQELPAALRVLKDGVAREVDLGRIGDLYFTESAGIGLFADAMVLQDPTDKSVLRTLWTAFRVLSSARARRVKLYIDGELHTERAVMCEVANSFRMGYAMPMAPDAKLTDGVLDVVIVGDLKLTEIIPYFRAMKAQLHHTLPKVQVLKAKEVRIESRHKMNVHCDDAVIGTTPVTISVAPRALKVLVDRL